LGEDLHSPKKNGRAVAICILFFRTRGEEASMATRQQVRDAVPVRNPRRGLKNQGDHKSAYGGNPPKKHLPTDGGQKGGLRGS
jgi:hypothetical protein